MGPTGSARPAETPSATPGSRPCRKPASASTTPEGAGAALARPAHLVRRFAWSLWWSAWPAGPDPAEERWARSHLSDGESALWVAMGRVDRRHGLRVARRVEADSRVDDADRPSLITAALLHDVGKTAAHLGTVGRVAAAVADRFADEATIARWRRRGGLAGRLSGHVEYPAIGADLLAAAGSAPLTVAWAREHHEGTDGWTVPARVGRVLADADE